MIRPFTYVGVVTPTNCCSIWEALILNKGFQCVRFKCVFTTSLECSWALMLFPITHTHICNIPGGTYKLLVTSLNTHTSSYHFGHSRNTHTHKIRNLCIEEKKRGYLALVGRFLGVPLFIY